MEENEPWGSVGGDHWGWHMLREALLTLPLPLMATGPQHGVCVMVLMVHGMVFGFYKFLAHSVVRIRVASPSESSVHVSRRHSLAQHLCHVDRLRGGIRREPWDCAGGRPRLGPCQPHLAVYQGLGSVLNFSWPHFLKLCRKLDLL